MAIQTDGSFAGCVNDNGPIFWGKFFIAEIEFYKSRFQKDFGDTFEIILCDEVHNLPKFSAFLNSPQDSNWQRIAKKRIEEIVSKQTGPLVIGLSATPKRAETGMFCKTKYITVDSVVRQLETQNIIPYANLESLIPTLPKDKKYLVYASHITKMKQLTEIFNQYGIKAIAIWSTNHQKNRTSEEQLRVRHPMNEEQLNARQYNQSAKFGIRHYHNFRVLKIYHVMGNKVEPIFCEMLGGMVFQYLFLSICGVDKIEHFVFVAHSFR